MHFDRGRQSMAALRCYAEAAEAALLNFNPAFCLSLTERARALVLQAPEGAERDALELTLATLQGMSAFHSLGVGSQAMTAFELAYALLASAPEHPMRARMLHGFGYLSSLRGDYVEALVVAKRAEALAAVSDDPELMLVACFLHGEAHHLQGRTQAARSWMERGLAIVETSTSRRTTCSRPTLKPACSGCWPSTSCAAAWCDKAGRWCSGRRRAPLRCGSR